jgi:hypothetical protein
MPMTQFSLWNMTTKSKKSEIDFRSFRAAFRPKINLYNSEVFCFGEAQDVASQYADLFTCG